MKAARQKQPDSDGAILDALPAHIAVIDAEGVIVSVNEVWRRFTGSTAAARPGHRIGRNYLHICEAAHGADAAAAHDVAQGIRAVLEGTVAGFSIAYSVDEFPRPRWLQLTAAPTAHGAVIMQLDIAAPARDSDESRPAHAASRRLGGEEALLHFGTAMDATADSIYLVDRASMTFVYVNAAACRMLARPREEVLGLEPWVMSQTSREELETTYDAIIAGTADKRPVEEMRRRPDGTHFWIELRRSAQRIGDRWTVVTLVRNITARRTAEAKIIRLNRVYAVLSGINSLIVRVRDQKVLFADACQIAVEHGGFPMAWIGTVDQLTKTIVPVASAGMRPEFIALIESRFSEREDAPLGGRSNAALALREKKPVVRNEIVGDTTMLFAADRAEYGINSMAILPLIVGGDAVGILALYSDDAEFFDAEEMILLQELAGDIAFAIDYIAKVEKLSYLAYFDPLTGLANRTLFRQRLEQNVLIACEQHRKLALIVIDVERFKTINDTLGWQAGDSVLKELAARLTFFAGDADRFARIDADHFAIFVADLQTEEDLAHRIEERFSQVFAAPVRIADADLRISAKIGIAMYPADGAEADSLFKNAQAALKIAKAGGERYVFYARTMNERIADKLALENELRHAIDREEFVLYYQPKVSVATGRLTGAEALIRWNHPRRGLVAPGQFIPMLEETGLILDVGRWALRRAVEDYLGWLAAGRAPVRIAVNVSPLQLRSRAFIEEIQEAIGVDARAAAGLELEITESVIMANVTYSISNLKIIRAMGVTIAIDDFGTGFSSLSYLSKLPIDTLKIDRAFVVDMEVGATGLALVSTIINLAHSLGHKVVAEGVETAEQLRLLRSLGCEEMQGFLFSPAIPREQFADRYLPVVDPCA